MKLTRITDEEYLKGESVSAVKHEYVGGIVYAMAGASNLHNDITGNTYLALRNRLRGRPGKPCNSDTKIRLRVGGHFRFYYPDVSVTCKPNPPQDHFQDEPALIGETVSRRTRRADEGEKKDAYLTIPSLGVYLLVEQESATVIAYRRTNREFVEEVYQGLDAVIPLPEIGGELQLSEIYEGVEFVPEPDG
jgi:Uma2 family endonuclease